MAVALVLRNRCREKRWPGWLIEIWWESCCRSVCSGAKTLWKAWGRGMCCVSAATISAWWIMSRGSSIPVGTACSGGFRKKDRRYRIHLHSGQQVLSGEHRNAQLAAAVDLRQFSVHALQRSVLCLRLHRRRTEQAAQGAVIYDPQKCIGCIACGNGVSACPYGARYCHPLRHIAGKCDFWGV